ncbi:asparagine synthase-related protein [Nonomuraea ferruginea]
MDTGIDPVALHHYMTFHSLVPGERTILAGVRKLPAATVRVIEADGTSTEHRYWEPRHRRPAAPADDGEWRRAVLDALRTAVRRRMVADVPVGVLLSGGLDSSLIVALLAEQGQRELATFSIGFEPYGGEQGDEFAYSDLVARRFGTDHHRIRVPDSRLAQGVEQAVHAMSEPMVSHDCVAFHLLSREVAGHVKVVQSGQGADEVFAGYDWFPPLAGVPRERAADTYLEAFRDRPHHDLARILAPDHLLGSDVSGDLVRAHLARPGADTALDAVLRLETTAMMVDDPVKRLDNMTMAHGLEARTPFLDHELVELAAACPAELKLADGGKGVLKDAARRMLPAEVADRPKGYFPVPADPARRRAAPRPRPRRAHQPGRPRPRPVPAGLRRPAARRPRPRQGGDRGEYAVAARPAGTVAAGPPRMTPEIIGGLSHLPSAASLTAWSCLAPALAPDDSAVAFVSDRDGSPRVWIQPVGEDAEAWVVDTGPQPAVDVSWAPTGARLAVLLAPGGGEHAQVWTVRPHGGDLRLLSAPAGGSAALVRWTGRGEEVLVAETSAARPHPRRAGRRRHGRASGHRRGPVDVARRPSAATTPRCCCGGARADGGTCTWRPSSPRRWARTCRAGSGRCCPDCRDPPTPAPSPPTAAPRTWSPTPAATGPRCWRCGRARTRSCWPSGRTPSWTGSR